MSTGWMKILQRFYEQGLIDEVKLENCVLQGLLEDFEKDAILNSQA